MRRALKKQRADGFTLHAVGCVFATLHDGLAAQAGRRRRPR